MSQTQIGSGNIIVFSLLCDLRQCLLTDLIKIYSQNTNVKHVIKTFIGQPFNEIDTEQISSLLLNEFNVKPAPHIENISQILLLNIAGTGYSRSNKKSLFEMFMILLSSNTKGLERDVLWQLDNPIPKTVLMLYTMAEIKNSFLKCGLKLKMYPLKKQSLKNKYTFYRTTMNQIQREIFGFTDSEYDKKGRVKFDILAMEKYAERVSNTDSSKIIDLLKIRLKVMSGLTGVKK
ncbi:MAG: hypothetical protein WC071_12500 [Victivallaceae bacterium]